MEIPIHNGSRYFGNPIDFHYDLSYNYRIQSVHAFEKKYILIKGLISLERLISAQKEKIKCAFKEDRDFSLYVLAGVFIGMATGIYNTIFNNYLNDVYHLTSGIRGAVEFPREMPGALIMVVLGFLSFLGDVKLASLAMAACALGFAGLGLYTPSFGIMLCWLVVYSLGNHLYMPLNPTIGMSLSQKENYGSRLGLYSAYMLASTIIGYAIVWIGFKFFGMHYHSAFIFSSVLYIVATIVFGLMKGRTEKRRKLHFVFRKKYALYYALSIVNGGRKQIFLTFAPWVLIQVYKLDPPVFAVLGVVVSLLSICTRTFVGWAIDHLGERFVLSSEAVLLFIICFGYTFSGDFLPKVIAMVVMAACYVIDNSMSVVEMARSTYVKKIAVCPEDVTPTLSTGISLDHIVAMSVPMLGGLLWAATGADGYKYIFMVDAVFAAAKLLPFEKN